MFSLAFVYARFPPAGITLLLYQHIPFAGLFSAAKQG
jgi:hypothetical protein